MAYHYVETTGPPGTAATISGPPLSLNIHCLRQLKEPMVQITFRWCRQSLLRSGRPHLESREWDAFGHCWIACEGCRVCGEFDASRLHFLYEVARELGYGGPHDSFRQDLRNAATGRYLSRQPGTCAMLCDQAHQGNMLDLTAPLTRQRYSLERGVHEIEIPTGRGRLPY